MDEAHLVTLDELHNRLDSLWVAYLDHLDTYNSAQKALQNHFSAGFLSLARANFKSRDGIRRYGKDYYNERAMASTRARITSAKNGHGAPQAEIVRWQDDDVEEVDPKQQKNKASGPRQQPSPSDTPRSELDDSNQEPTLALVDLSRQDGQVHEEAAAAASKSTANTDPLRWFGILVPPDLRAAQSSFVAAVNEHTAAAVTAARSLRELEVDIRRTRKDVKRAEKSLT